jgi:hypothetical protein
LKFGRAIPREVRELFHHLRIVGNKATHDNEGTHAEALNEWRLQREALFPKYWPILGGAAWPPSTRRRRMPVAKELGSANSGEFEATLQREVQVVADGRSQRD